MELLAVTLLIARIIVGTAEAVTDNKTAIDIKSIMSSGYGNKKENKEKKCLFGTQ